MRTIAVTSGKGGVGKSTLSLNLGSTLAKMGKKAIVFDCDFALANLDLFLKDQPKFTLRHVLSGEKTIKEIVSDGPGGVGVIAGASAIGSLIHAGPKRLGLFLEQLKELEDTCDYLILDTGAGIDSKVLTILKAAHDVFLVTTPDPASVTDAYATAKVLFRQKPTAKVYVLANLISSAAEGHVLHKTLQSISLKFLKHDLDYIGHVRRDKAVGDCVRNRVSFAVESSKFEASADLCEIAKVLCTWAVPGNSFYDDFAQAAANADKEAA